LTGWPRLSGRGAVSRGGLKKYVRLIGEDARAFGGEAAGAVYVRLIGSNGDATPRGAVAGALRGSMSG